MWGGAGRLAGTGHAPRQKFRGVRAEGLCPRKQGSSADPGLTQSLAGGDNHAAYGPSHGPPFAGSFCSLSSLVPLCGDSSGTHTFLLLPCAYSCPSEGGLSQKGKGSDALEREPVCSLTPQCLREV